MQKSSGAKNLLHNSQFLKACEAEHESVVKLRCVSDLASSSDSKLDNRVAQFQRCPHPRTETGKKNKFLEVRIQLSIHEVRSPVASKNNSTCFRLCPVEPPAMLHHHTSRQKRLYLRVSGSCRTLEECLGTPSAVIASFFKVRVLTSAF